MDFSNLFKNLNISEDCFAVAVSGGIDSLALTFLAKEYLGKKIIALTVDHKLRSSSTKEALYIHNLLKKNNIEHHILTWEGDKPKHNIELVAREKRYELITNFCKKHNIKSLFVAHHLQDQAETFLIRLFRGSGIDGLSSMKKENEIYGIKILRPLLNIKKEDLKEYLIKNKIEWVEDESNNDEKYLRNKIRNFLNSLDDKDNILNRINNTVEEINLSKTIIEKEQSNFEDKNVFYNELGFCKINLNKLIKQNEYLSLRIIAKYLIKIGGKIYKPRFENLKSLYKKIKNKTDKKETFYNCFLKIDNEFLYIYKEYSKIQKEIFLEKDIFWDNRIEIKFSKKNKGFRVSSIKNFGFNKLLKVQKEINYNLYKKLKNMKGIEKEIFYTLPIIFSEEKKDYIVFNI